jgi:flagellar motor protein MotB
MNDALTEVRFRGNAWLDGFSLAEGAATEGLLRWKSLRLSGIEASLNPPVISATNATLDDVFARLIIETNRTINLMSALRRGGTNVAAVLPSTNMAVAVRPKLTLGSLVLSNGNVHFIDRSLRPNVNINLEQLGGTISLLSSDDPQRADVLLEGTVEKTAHARITGKINPWNSKQPLDLKISLQSMDLLPANPYSSKYLGYQLKQGKLSAQLGYEVTERKLKSENRLAIDQLTLGQKVESADATSLPVRLAIALLKDRDGRIALDVPFSGSLDDPQFNLGGVVAHALETIVARIVASPFSALGALFGGKGQELSFQEFQPGSTNLSPAALAKLDVLAKALYERPELQLEIEGSADPVTDLAALRRAKFNDQLPLEKRNAVANLLLTGTNAAVQEEPPARNSRKTFSFEKGASGLRSPVAYWSRRHASDENERSSHRTRAFADDKGATALMLIFAPEEHAGDPDEERELLEAVEMKPDALRTLAHERAQNVKAYLLRTGKVELQRITDSARGDSSKGSRVYLWLQ